ncbi:hypothetical protein ASD79_10000 [Caulobacter sp. Root655]|uniref:hypothetical protein n=1 Tax=Caulobacter sp. Root655 TaxID=1736578 RepID=UPI0006FBF25D|nr:hypothetical protein [Caulobacter sp. Root655]KRA59860.1 hypothetical protein ASD79_10000 [Caulobacter sp. Root655]
MDVSRAEAAVPASHRVSGAGVAPATAWGVYGGATTHTTGVAAWTSPSPEIRALGRALGANRLPADTFAQNVARYVRNNIATEFRFGLSKGGRGALIDGSGTAFDQAELMVQLLAQGNVAASYQIGTISLSAQQFGAWTGLVKDLDSANQVFSVDARAACKFLADGAIPLAIGGSSDCNAISGNLPTTANAVTLGHVWVTANGKAYDPAFKVNRLKAGVDIAAAAGCGTQASNTCGSGLVGAMMNGASAVTQGGMDTLTSLNEPALGDKLQAYAQNVQTYVAATLPAANLSDIVGGAELDQTYDPVPAGALPYVSQSVVEISGAVPDQYRTTLRVAAAPFDVTFFADEIAGRRTLLVPYAKQLFTDDILVQTVSGAPAKTVTLTATHPYVSSTPGHRTETASLDYGYGPWVDPIASHSGPILIMASWGDTMPSAASYYSALQKANPSPFVGSSGAPAGDCRANLRHKGGNTTDVLDSCRADSALSSAAQLVIQQALARRMLARVAGVSITQHHSLGIQVNNVLNSGTTIYKVFNEVSSWSIESQKSDVSAETATFAALASLSAMQEGSVLQQTADTNHAGSTASAFFLANRNGATFYDVPAASMASFAPTLKGPYIYSTGPYALKNIPAEYVSILSGAASSGTRFIVPQYTALPTLNGSYMPAGPGASVGQDASGGVSYLFNMTYKGGADALRRDPAKEAQDLIKQTAAALAAKSYASVDLASGDLKMSPPADLVTGVGGFPFALAMQRTYVSGAETSETNELYERSVNYQPVPPKTMGTKGVAPTYDYTYDGPDADVGGRIGGGWTYNFAISARVGNDAMGLLGKSGGLDASAAISTLYALVELNRSTGFQVRMADILANHWLGARFMRNAITVRVGPESKSFHLLPDKTYNAAPGQADRIVIVNGVGIQNDIIKSYSTSKFEYVDASGNRLRFNPTHGDVYIGDGAANCASTQSANFLPDDWVFVGGVKVTFTYQGNCVTYREISDNTWLEEPSSTYIGKTFLLTKVANSTGRSLTFSYPSQYSSLGQHITGVTDENGRTVSYALTDCPPLYANNGGGQATERYLTCNNLTVTAAEGVTRYSYAPGADSPDPAGAVRPTYRLRRWYSPLNTATPFETVVYDDLYHVASITDANQHAVRYYLATVSPADAFKTVDILDASGATSTTRFNAASAPIEAIDPLNRTTRWVYDGLNRKSLEVRPEKDSTAWTYDVRSNLVSTTSHPKPGSGLADIVTRTVYGEEETVRLCVNILVCNKPIREVDAKNAATKLEWDASGTLSWIEPPLDANGGAPRTDYAYQSFTGTDGVAFMLLSGKTDRIGASQTLVTTYDYDTTNHFTWKSATVDPGHLNLRTCFKFDVVGNLIGTTDPRAGVCQ